MNSLFVKRKQNFPSYKLVKRLIKKFWLSSVTVAIVILCQVMCQCHSVEIINDELSSWSCIREYIISIAFPEKTTLSPLLVSFTFWIGYYGGVDIINYHNNVITHNLSFHVYKTNLLSYSIITRSLLIVLSEDDSFLELSAQWSCGLQHFGLLQVKSHYNCGALSPSAWYPNIPTRIKFAQLCRLLNKKQNQNRKW